MSDIEIKNPYNLDSYRTKKSSIIDIKAQDNEGSCYNIILQLGERKHYDKRALFYWSKLYSDQLNEWHIYSKLKKTISIHILDFNMLPGLEYHNEYRVRNTINNNDLSDDFELHFIELRKFNKDLEHLSYSLDRWITFFNKAQQYHQSNIPEHLLVDEAVAKAIKRLDAMGFSEEERQYYQNELNDNRDFINKRLNLYYELAVKMLEENEPIEKIIKYTDLDIDVINALDEERKLNQS